jgi:hypothetical protein
MVDVPDDLPTGEQLLIMFKRSLNKDPEEAFNEIFGPSLLVGTQAQSTRESPSPSQPASRSRAPTGRSVRNRSRAASRTRGSRRPN